MASSTRVGRFPRQLVIMVSAETGDLVDELAAKHGESKAEVARTFLEAGIKSATSPSPEFAELVDAFKTAWEEADERGLAGRRTESGLRAVLDRLNASVS